MVRWEESGLNSRSAEISDLQSDEPPFQRGVPLDAPEGEETQNVEDLCPEVLMVRISEFHESDDDSMEWLNLDNYNFDDYDEYLSENMETSPMVIMKIKISIKLDPPLAPPTVMVTVQLEDEPVVEDFYERRRIHNKK